MSFYTADLCDAYEADPRTTKPVFSVLLAQIFGPASSSIVIRMESS